jgi:glutathione synthase/RimK-type ligase-like ATP-grasp enzyme
MRVIIIVMRITVSDKLIKKMRLNPQADIYVRAGMKKVKSNLEIRSDLSQPFILSEELAKALQVEVDSKLQLRYDAKSDSLHLGPFVGILVSSLPNKGEYNPKSLQAELIYLSKISNNMWAQVFVFTPHCIDWPSKTTRGYVYKQSSDKFGIWVESQYPLPDVVYDRISSRSSEARANIIMTKRRLMKQPDLKYFNPSFLNKWRVYKLLSANEALIAYLPETKLLNRLNLEDMLHRHGVIFIKPANGSLGKGILKAWKENNSDILYRVYGNKTHHGNASNASDLLRRIQPIIQDKSYIVQQGIDLVKYQDAAFDIRIIYQKNGAGEWIISKKFVRVAAPGSSISNLSSGGRVERSATVLGHIFQHNKRLIAENNKELNKLCELVANTLEINDQGVFGELGLDIGIDQKGQLCLIEVNSKPRKTTETELSKIIVHNTFRRPLEFAVYLAGFKNAKR